MAYKISKEKCIGCLACLENCPVAAIKQDEDGKCVIDKDICIECGMCASICPVEAPSLED